MKSELSDAVDRYIPPALVHFMRFVWLMAILSFFGAGFVAGVAAAVTIGWMQ
jgi:hypothetical protein